MCRVALKSKERSALVDGPYRRLGGDAWLNRPPCPSKRSCSPGSCESKMYVLRPTALTKPTFESSIHGERSTNSPASYARPAKTPRPAFGMVEAAMRLNAVGTSSCTDVEVRARQSVSAAAAQTTTRFDRHVISCIASLRPGHDRSRRLLVCLVNEADVRARRLPVASLRASEPPHLLPLCPCSLSLSLSPSRPISLSLSLSLSLIHTHSVHSRWHTLTPTSQTQSIDCSPVVPRRYWRQRARCRRSLRPEDARGRPSVPCIRTSHLPGVSPILMMRCAPTAPSVASVLQVARDLQQPTWSRRATAKRSAHPRRRHVRSRRHMKGRTSTAVPSCYISVGKSAPPRYMHGPPKRAARTAVTSRWRRARRSRARWPAARAGSCCPMRRARRRGRAARRGCCQHSTWPSGGCLGCPCRGAPTWTAS